MTDRIPPISRRQAVKLLAATSAGLALSEIPATSQLSAQGGQLGPTSPPARPAQLWITPASARTLRISLIPTPADGAVQQLPESIVLTPLRWPEPLEKLPLTPARQNFQWGEYRIEISAPPLRLKLQSKAGATIQNLEIDAQSGSVRFALQGSVFGLGEGGPQFDRRGSAYPMKHGEGVPDMRIDGARLPIPWLMGTEGWGLFFHLPFGTFDLTGKTGVFERNPTAPPLPLDFFLVAAEDPGQMLAEYARLTGFPHMPPLWALGYQQSHRTLASREEVLGELQTFRRKRLPCDTMIYLGTGFCPSGWNLGHGSYDFNPRVFPDPAAMIDEMHRQDFRIVLHEDKPPKQLHGRAGDTGAAARDPEDAANYWQKHVKVFDLGVDGWWADEGDWLDNISRLVRNRMYWEGAQLERPNVRPYTLNRNGYAGIQRYGWLWSGDINSTWQTLREQIAVGLNTGLSGMPYWGTDTGGFAVTPELTGELYVRWFEFSAFCPLFRSHGRTWKLRLPWGWDTGSYGPIESPEASLPPLSDLHDARVEPICRKYLNLRYQLLPYLYTAVREAHDTGIPIMRALWMHDPKDVHAAGLSDQYLFGSDLLIAPVVEQGAKLRKVYLPRGSWHDFWTEEKASGGREVIRAVDLETMPIYVRAGTILPLGPVKQFTAEASKQPISLVVYPGSDGESSVYEDDAETFDFEQGAFFRTRLEWNDRKRRLSILLAPAKRHYPARRFAIRIASESKAREVTFDGRPLTVDL